MRIVKKAEERRNEILDAADELFASKGYNGTSTNDILEKVGIARGTLYHHFKTKEEIMDSLIERYSERMLDATQAVASDKSIPVVERMIRSVMAMNLRGGSSEEIMKHIHKPENALMHQKIQNVILSRVTPLLADIIHDGIEQGLFHTPFPYETMEMIMIYANTVLGEELVDLSEQERAARLQAFVFNTERLLGAESGSLMNVMQLLFGGAEHGGHE